MFIALLDAPWSLLFIALIFVFSPILGLVSVAGLLILLGLGVLSELMDAGRAKPLRRPPAKPMPRLTK
ncbi:hypothetical protein [Phaeobacter inhibens]|uniref:hypothetical protein n=1 Tax=Phaeobacter inhibens TaxID=221822 RepID=UPI0021A4AD30|nr:hypothetical protein [Phaeobacter inhibens]